MSETLVWINPRNHEYRMALIHSPPDERRLRPQVEYIELVDPGRHDNERPPFNLNGRGSVLDQLHKLILEDDLPRCGGYVLTEPKSLQIGHSDRKSSATAFEVIQQICQASEKILAAGFDRGLQYLRVGRKKIGRSHGIYELSCIEVHLVCRFRIETIDAINRRQNCLGGKQVALLDIVEKKVFGPSRVLKAPIGRGRAVMRFVADTSQPFCYTLHQFHMLPPQL